MSQPSTEEHTRRENWAAQENRRRQDEYQRADLAWIQDERLLDWMLSTARSGTGFLPQQLGSTFDAKRGEPLFGVLNNCRLIEVKHSSGDYPRGSSGFSFQIARAIQSRVTGSRGTSVPGADDLRITDEGRAVVSDRRIVFDGHRHREWALDKLTGLQHDPSRPITLIHVSNRRKVYGFAYPPEQAPVARYALELGAAAHTGNTGALIAFLQTERGQHARLRPPRPPIASPDDAPSMLASLGAGFRDLVTPESKARGRRVLRNVAVGGMAILILGAGVSALAHPSAGDQEEAAHGAPATAMTTTMPTAGASAEITSAALDEPSLSPTPNPSSTPSSTPSPSLTPMPTPTPTLDPSPTIEPDQDVQKVKVGARPTPPKLLRTTAASERVGAICRDGSSSDATGRGACSWHGGVRKWIYEKPYWVVENKATNAARTKKYKAALKTWNAQTSRNRLLARYPYSKGPYKKGSPGYATWRDTNRNGIACDH